MTPQTLLALLTLSSGVLGIAFTVATLVRQLSGFFAGAALCFFAAFLLGLVTLIQAVS